MIAALRGTLVEKASNRIILEVGGVGYQVYIPLSTFAALGDLHSEVTLLIHTHLREDQLALYGFLTAREKRLFELLISASGVGPGLALRILSGMSVDELVPAIRAGDLEQLVRIPGIGKKTAERIVLELREKLATPELDQAAVRTARSPVESDVVSALVNLGYDRRAVEKAVGQARKDGAATNFEVLLRAALQELSGSAAAGQGARSRRASG